jgi:hypothetical protein
MEPDILPWILGVSLVEGSDILWDEEYLVRPHVILLAIKAYGYLSTRG